MAYKVEFHPDAEKDFAHLDGSVRKEVAKKIDSLSENPLSGKPLGNKFGVDLTGFYKLYVDRGKYRIVYRLMGEHIEVIEIVGIGKRDKEEVYRMVARRVKRMLKHISRQPASG